MERQYSHLTWKTRLKIRRMLDERRKPKEIADALHVHTSTIYREIKRGQTWQMTSEWEYVQKYCPETAERKYRENLQAKGPDLKIGNDHALASYLEEKIGKEHYSPAAALAKIKEEGRIFSVEISEWTLYSYIDKGVFATITNKSLPTGKKKKHPYRKVQEARLPKGDGIEDRSEEINSRKTFGRWEMDTVVSARRSKKRLLVLTERLTRWEIIELMKDGTSASVVAALNRMERKLGSAAFREMFRSITIDNGVEFADCAGMESSCRRSGARTHVYYCHPYSAYERGSNEAANRIIRRFLPKGTDFSSLTRQKVKEIEAWMNDYPREKLGWKSANRAIAEHARALSIDIQKL